MRNLVFLLIVILIAGCVSATTSSVVIGDTEVKVEEPTAAPLTAPEGAVQEQASGVGGDGGRRRERRERRERPARERRERPAAGMAAGDAVEAETGAPMRATRPTTSTRVPALQSGPFLSRATLP